MTDIIIRLHRMVNLSLTDDRSVVEAVEEIERLRSELRSERERCAAIAERIGQEWGGEPAAMGNSIAKQIRGQEMEEIILPNVRKIFVPDRGWTIFDCDLSGADAQVVAWEAEDEDLKTAFRRGLDVHSKNAEDMMGPQFTRLEGNARKRARQSNKHAVHGTNYGASPQGLAHHPAIGWTVHEADLFQKRWFSLHPKIGPSSVPGTWHHRVQQSINKSKMVSNKFGYRRIYFDRPDEVFTEALAWVPQSTVALVSFYGAIKLARNFLQKEEVPWPTYIRAGNPNIEILLQNHDSLVFQVRDMDAYRTKEMKALLNTPIPYDDPLLIPWGF